MMKKILLTLLLLCATYEVISFGNLRIEPEVESHKALLRYVGDNVSFSCIHDKKEITDKSFLSQSFSNPVSYTLNWVIPTNGEDRVDFQKFEDNVTIHIKNIRETDHGNYTCVLSQNGGTNSETINDYIYLAVRPRGRLSSCNENSFFCEKTLCIPARYKCDGHSDCPDGIDESPHHCGSEVCKDKLSCDDGRCLSPSVCCKEPSKSPPNCTIHPNILCCRQLIHPAILDQDLFYHHLASRPQKKKTWQDYSAMLFYSVSGAVVVLMLFLIFLLVMSEKRRKFEATFIDRNTSQSHHGPCLSRISDLSSRYRNSEDIIMLPMRRSSPQVNDMLCHLDCEPPPSYHQVIGGPPPPYSSQSDSSAVASTIRLNSHQSLLIPLLNSSEASESSSSMSIPGIPSTPSSSSTPSIVSSSGISLPRRDRSNRC